LNFIYKLVFNCYSLFVFFYFSFQNFDFFYYNG